MKDDEFLKIWTTGGCIAMILLAVIAIIGALIEVLK